MKTPDYLVIPGLAGLLTVLVCLPLSHLPSRKQAQPRVSQSSAPQARPAVADLASGPLIGERPTRSTREGSAWLPVLTIRTNRAGQIVVTQWGTDGRGEAAIMEHAFQVDGFEVLEGPGTNSAIYRCLKRPKPSPDD